ncbi:hypothetical protein DYB30_010573, partial [Aphanomyces astaci]
MDELTLGLLREGEAWNANWMAIAEAANGNVSWMQEGAQEGYQFRRFGENKTFYRYCEGCSKNGCPLACEASNSPTICMATLSPYQYPCVTVAGPETGLLLSQARVAITSVFYSVDIVQFRIDFIDNKKPIDWCCILRLVVSLQYVQNMGLGFALYFLSPLLAHSRLFHFVLGAAIGIVCSIALLLYQLYKQSQSTLRLLPGASFLQSASVLTTL